MSRKPHVKLEPVSERGTCIECRERPQRKNGRGGYMPRCRICTKRKYPPSVKSYGRLRDIARNPYKSYRGPICEKCGFVPVHECQLDVDHIDGNKGNPDPENLQTLCANCHRLKSLLNRDHHRKLKTV